MAYTELSNSTFMDFTSWRSNASPPSGGVPIRGPVKLNVALVLDRANDPTALLQGDWGTRQKELKELNESGTLWTTYGADPAKYAEVLTALEALGIKTVDQISAETGTSNGYVSSAESRTVWVQVTEDSFSTLFGPQAVLMAGNAHGHGPWHWTGSLALPAALADLGVSGIWFDEVGQFTSRVADPGTGRTADLPHRSQSPGNVSAEAPGLFPQVIGDYYHMPLGSGVPTGTIGLVEPGVGTALPGDPSGSHFQRALDFYRQQAGVPTSAPAISVAHGGQQYPANVSTPGNAAGERSLDVGVVSTVSPNSPLVLYAGSGTNLGAQHAPYTVYQSAFWDLANNPPVIGASPDITQHVAPGSPFYKASTQLFVDAALRNISVFNAIGDGGSGGQYANGLTNISSSRSLGYSVMVGGTSFSTMRAAATDVTLADLIERARSGDRATIWSLVAGGMIRSPAHGADDHAFVETIWNSYYLRDKSFIEPRTGRPSSGYLGNNAGAGGVDPSQPTPQYQKDYGLAPVTPDPSRLPGRGTPDVSANAGGNMFWRTPGADMILKEGRAEGTSAAAPFWAALGAQLSAIFVDQGLPRLGYMNDLLYIASAIAPPSFNDVTIGNNTSSFVLGGHYTSDGTTITPTGYGYEAGPGYDLASGLGTPNGTLLARALTAIAHHQVSFPSIPDMLVSDSHGGWTSGADQSLMFQAMSGRGAEVDVTLGSGGVEYHSGVSGTFAWTNRFAQQTLQADFDADLVRLYDKQAQGWMAQQAVTAGDVVAVAIDSSSARAVQGTLTNPFGFADFVAQDGAVRVARPVAVAETAGGADDQVAVVRLRQNGEDSLSLAFYRVDDLDGTIDGLSPDDAGYAAAAQARAYGMITGGTSIAGPGYGDFTQTGLVDVDAGDLIAMQLTNNTSGDAYWAFAHANETVGDRHVGHLWSYGLNTWGWEDLRGGGDRDFNDLVVQLDFTSAAGRGWLV